MAQSRNDRLDESLGMRRGKESGKSQSYMDRRDESRGSSKKGSMFSVQDNQQSGEVRKVNTNSEQYDLNRIKPYKAGPKGYSSEAWNYTY